MRTVLDRPPESLDGDERTFVDTVREHGWLRTSVFGDDDNPPFSYTTGFWAGCGQPELILFSLKREIAHDMFWDLFRNAQAGTAIPIGRRTDQLFGNLPAYAFPVAKRFYADHLGWSRWFHQGDAFPCLQIVWPDRAGLFPWEEGFDHDFAADQPDLTEYGWRASIVD